MDALLFVTSEYNRSIPGGLKNAIDWASRPQGTNSFTHKRSALIGTAIAQHGLRSALSFCNSPQLNVLVAYIQFKPGLIRDDGKISIASTDEFLRGYMLEFGTCVARVISVLPNEASCVAHSLRVSSHVTDSVGFPGKEMPPIGSAHAFAASGERGRTNDRAPIVSRFSW